MASNPATKTDSSYYFFKTTPPEQAAQYRPQAITGEATPTTAVTNGASAWNAAGTWEELNITEWADETLEKLFIGIKPTNGVDVSITECDDVTGSASLVWSRGKKRVNYEYDVVLKWSGTVDGVEASGTITLVEMDPTNVDDFTIKYKADKSDDAHATLLAAMKTCQKQIREKMQQFEKEAVLQE